MVLDVVGLRRPRQGPDRHLLRRHEAPGQHRRRHAARADGCSSSTSRPSASIRRAATRSWNRWMRWAPSGMAVLYTTHYMEEAERLCDRIGIIDQGRLIAEGTRAELIAGLGEAASVSVRAEGRCTNHAQWRGAGGRARGHRRQPGTRTAPRSPATTHQRPWRPPSPPPRARGHHWWRWRSATPDLEAVFL